MDHFSYRNGTLYAEDVPINEIVTAVGTPVYIYSSAMLCQHFKTFETAFADLDHLICYAMKANSNQAVLRLLGNLGAGMDVVSKGEYARAISAGIAPEKIVFSGVGKTQDEIATALKGGIRQFNVESEPELSALSQVAEALGKAAPITLRINPDINAGAHDKISTGRRGDKFGIPFERAEAVYAQAARLPGIEIVGIDTHIGSQINTLAPFRQAYRKIAALVEVLRAQSHKISRLDIGGGLGIADGQCQAPPPTPADLSEIVKAELGHLGCQIELEPGRFIAGNAGIMVSKVIYVKEGQGRSFLILDGAMNDLVRPAMYDAYHDIIPVTENTSHATRQQEYDVVGPICESSDIFARARQMAKCSAGDLVALRSAGAYGATMASEYNTRPLIAEVLVDKDRFAIIRPRARIEEIIARDIIPDWLV